MKHKIHYNNQEISVFFTSFYPLCCTSYGKGAIGSPYNLPPYIDGSCRREPDFENEFPAITGLCRPGFVDRLDVDDLVIYTTNKKFLGTKRLVAILQVLEIKDDHIQASQWYVNKVLPNNIMVEGNDPVPLEKTHFIGPWIDFAWTKKESEERDENEDQEGIDYWDATYKKRSREKSKVAICKILNGICEIHHPTLMKDDDIIGIFGRKPGTQTPPSLTQEEWDAFAGWLQKSSQFRL